ncbi:MAG: hypothetical protein A2046_13685 [Bacteroidetes bacterium GWA2_30_7]|nr:MAG: hypothetical protein A2046_13685 [Bacteroidetes bacterium GWA2_30_7]
MKRKFVTNLALLIFLNLLVKPFWIFGIDRSVQNVVGAEQYGMYFALFNFSLLLNIILDLGITNYNNRNIAQHSQLFSKHLSNIVVLKFLLAVLYLIISVSAAIIIGYEWKQMKLLLFLVLNQFIISFTLYLRSNLSGLHLFKTDSLVSILDRILMIIICSILLWGHITDSPFSIAWFVYAQSAAYFITALVTFIIVWSKLDFLHLNFDLSFFIVFLRQSYPYALLILLMSFYNRIDTVMLERMLPDGKVQAGIYAQAFRILDAATMFAFLFSTLLLPMFAKMIKLKEKVGQLMQLSYVLLIVPAFILAIISYFYKDEIMELLYKNHVSNSSPIFAVLMMGFVSISTTYIFGTLLTANGNLKALNIMALIGMVLNIVLNLILIPKFSALGSAYASLTTQTFTAVVQVIIAMNIFKFRFNYMLAFRLFIFITVSLLAGYVVTSYIHSWFIGLLTISLFSLFIALLIKLINFKSLMILIFHGEGN